MAPQNKLNYITNKLFQPVNQELRKNYNSFVAKGSLITFNYSLAKHDFYPLVIVTDWNAGFMRGVNLHYLTFPYIRNILRTGCEMNTFSYAIFKGDSYITSAFRTYKMVGVRGVRKLDCNFILKMMTIARSFDPTQIKLIRQEIQNQIDQIVNPKAISTEVQV